MRGEIAFVVEAGAAAETAAPPDAGLVEDAIAELIAQGLSTSAIAKTLAERGCGERRHLYARVTELRRAGPGLSEA